MKKWSGNTGKETDYQRMLDSGNRKARRLAERKLRAQKNRGGENRDEVAASLENAAQ